MKNQSNKLLLVAALFGLLSTITSQSALGYPLDGEPHTGISRLEGYLYSLRTESGDTNLENGALMSFDEVAPRLAGERIAVPAPDRQFTAEVRALLGKNAKDIAIAVLDVSDLGHPRYAVHNGGRQFVPGSVGKVLVATALFHALSLQHPVDIEARMELLRSRELTADGIITTDEHEVPFWHKTGKSGRIVLRPIIEGDTANLWTYLDWMMSASSNAAASMVMREVLLMRQFGKQYPPTSSQAELFMKGRGGTSVQTILARAMRQPIAAAGLNPATLRQGSFFTKGGRRLVSSIGSTANVENLLRWLLLMEQGRLIDAFSSTEIKRLLYLTQKRTRYAAAPELKDSAVFYKSGSLYKCAAERGYVCKQFLGNRLNVLNSIAVIESPAPDRRLFYLVALSTNVLRTNSAELHEDIAGRLHLLIANSHRSAATPRSERAAHQGN